MLKIINMSTGDTIVEVLISTLVLSLILTAAYATSLSSREQIVEAQERNQAVGIAQSQVEILRVESSNTAGLASPLNIAPGGYLAPTTKSFCYPTSSNSFTPNTGNNCVFNAGGSAGTYNVAIQSICPGGGESCTTSTNQTNESIGTFSTYSFSITVSWEGATNNSSQVVLYYRVAV
jgi:Tfp pilus assembly protein PilV